MLPIVVENQEYVTVALPPVAEHQISQKKSLKRVSNSSPTVQA
jgi:hypothetical protein